MSVRDDKATELKLRQKIASNQAKLKEMVSKVQNEYRALDYDLQCIISCNQSATEDSFLFHLDINEEALESSNPKIEEMWQNRYHKNIISMRDTMMEYAERFKMYPFKFEVYDSTGCALFLGDIDANGKTTLFG